MNTSKAILGIILLAAFGGAGYFAYQSYLAPLPQATPPATAQPAQEQAGRVSAEGKVAPARQVSLAFTRSGRVVEVLVKEGDQVRAGDVLARLDAQPLEASQKQAQAALDSANASLQAARTRAEAARRAARQADAPGRVKAWEQDIPDEFKQPVWYFQKAQQIASAQKEVDSAGAALDVEKTNLQTVLERASSADLLAAEARLADAQAAFLVAKDVLDRAGKASGHDLRDRAQTSYDSARSELDAAQAAYDQALDTQAAKDVTEARSRLAVAQARSDTAMDRLDALQTGEDSLEVRSADEAVKLAEASVVEAGAALNAANVALKEATLAAPVDGIVAQSDIQTGEVATVGRQAFLLVDLSAWKVETTDLSETDVALLQPGMPATITLDAFPGRTFTGKIEIISLIGEDSRGSVTYQVTLDFDPGDAPVRWGMTAFVDIPRP